MSVSELATTPGTTTPGTTTPGTTPPAPAPVRPRAWTVGRVEEIPLGEGRAFVAGETPVAVFRLRDGSLHATQAACPHAGGPLADGQTDRTVLVCPLHLYAFRWADGGCASAALALRTYPVREVDGALVVDA